MHIHLYVVDYSYLRAFVEYYNVPAIGSDRSVEQPPRSSWRGESSRLAELHTRKFSQAELLDCNIYIFIYLMPMLKPRGHQCSDFVPQVPLSQSSSIPITSTSISNCQQTIILSKMCSTNLSSFHKIISSRSSALWKAPKQKFRMRAYFVDIIIIINFTLGRFFSTQHLILFCRCNIIN